MRLLRIGLFFICLFLSPEGKSQKIPIEMKISPNLLKEINRGKLKDKTDLRITVIGETPPSDINSPLFNPQFVYKTGGYSVYTVTCKVKEMLESLVQSEKIIFIESGYRKPIEELQVSSLDLSVNKINLVHSRFPILNGEGLVVSVKENKPDSADIDFAGRFLTTKLNSNLISSHATIMSTMIGGGGNSWHLGKGVAWGSSISSSDFKSLLPDPDLAYSQYNITVQNHSYGVGVENYYGSDAALYDISTINNKKLLHVFSSGNSGLASATTGLYTGIIGFANLTGSFKMAKNILTVGASDSFNVVELLSSKGPAHDGRVKPELVAFGEDGSSGAAALVSGVSLILQQAYVNMHDSLPENALLKSILLNSADDISNKEVDYSTGFGSLNANNALKTIHAARYFSGSVTNGSSRSFTLTIPAGLKKFKTTLVWNDLPAIPNVVKTLINDLDMELENVLTGERWKPWVLNSYPQIDSLRKPAERKRDSINNVEQITLDNPEGGLYLLHVKGFNVSAVQDFFLSYQLDSADVFEWQFPGSNDFVTSAQSSIVRWEPIKASGLLEYSIDSGINWQTIQSNVNLLSGFYRWNVPDIFQKTLLRMSIGTNRFISDTFTISTRTLTGVGFNCPDSVLFYWGKLKGVKDYRVYALDNQYLEPITVSADSQIVLSKKSHPSLHYAVAPLISGKEGMRSYTFDYSRQGVECYIRSFLGLLDNDSARLELILGTLYGIKAIVLEKQMNGQFAQLGKWQSPVNLQNTFTDSKINNGLNIYRVKLELANGSIIYTQSETVYNLSKKNFIIYPNPVQQFHPLEILTNTNIITDVNLEVYDIKGRKVSTKVLKNFREEISTNQLSKGMYIFRFIILGEKDTILKVIVQ
jgi:hypothetical protein